MVQISDHFLAQWRMEEGGGTLRGVGEEVGAGLYCGVLLLPDGPLLWLHPILPVTLRSLPCRLPTARAPFGLVVSLCEEKRAELDALGSRVEAAAHRVQITTCAKLSSYATAEPPRSGVLIRVRGPLITQK